MATTDRVPPQDLNAEKCVLGCQIISNTAIDDVREMITPKDFYSDIHATIQQALLTLRDAGQQVDALLLGEQLNKSGDFEDIGGAGYILEIMDAVPHPEHAKYYAKIVRKMARRREAIHIGQKLMEDAWNLTKDDQDVTEAAMKAAESLADNSAVSSKISILFNVVSDVIMGFAKGVKPSINALIPEIDAITGGAVPGEMIVIGGRPSHGKSLVALQSLDCASYNGLPSLIISEEMAAASLGTRMIQRITPISSYDWVEQSSRVWNDAQEHFKGRSPILIAEKCGTATAAERAIASAVRSHGVRVVAVDYAQLLKGTGDNEQERIGDVSQRMKAIATKYDLIVLLLAQLNRGIESRENPEPQLADLRGSGSLEQDADIALFPFWPWQLDKSYADPTEYRVYQRKNRNRGIPVTCLKMRINPARQVLSTYEEDPTLFDGDFK